MNSGLKDINKIRKMCLEQGKDLVWHGMNLSKLKHIDKNNGTMEAYTTQRYWEDGKLRKDNQPDYNDSFWYHGWSFSRDKSVSARFGAILWAFDLREIKKDFKTIPISWNFTIGSMRKNSADHKKEQEEFVIAHKGKFSLEDISRKSIEYQDRIDEVQELLGKHKNKDINLNNDELQKLEDEKIKIDEFFETNWFEKIMAGPKGKTMNIKDKAIGFFVVNKNLKDEDIERLKTHPQFLGIIEPQELEPKATVKNNIFKIK